MKKQIKLFSFRKWNYYLTINTTKDIDFYNEFQISVTWKNAWSIDNVLKEKTNSRYIIFELFNRRLVEFTGKKITRYEEKRKAVSNG